MNNGINDLQGECMSTVLRIYRAASGQWSGVILRDGLEVGRIAGCASPDEVEESACAIGIESYSVEML